MGKWLNEFKELIWMSSIAVAIVIYLMTTFSTQSALAEKEASIKEYVDEKHESVKSTLTDMKTTLERIDQRVYDLKVKSAK